jgi:hypothetical protein
MLLYFCNPILDGLKKWTTKHEMGFKPKKIKIWDPRLLIPILRLTNVKKKEILALPEPKRYVRSRVS